MESGLHMKVCFQLVNRTYLGAPDDRWFAAGHRDQLSSDIMLVSRS